MGKVLEEAREENMEFYKDFSKDLEIKMIMNIVEDLIETKHDNECWEKFYITVNKFQQISASTVRAQQQQNTKM